MINPLQRYLENADYKIEVHLDMDEWTAIFPAKYELCDLKERTVVYDIEDIIAQIGEVKRYCITYYIVAHIILECYALNYHPSLVFYYDENDIQITEDEAIYYYEEEMEEEEFEKLIYLTSALNDIVDGCNINNVKGQAAKYDCDKDLLLLHNIVRRDE